MEFNLADLFEAVVDTTGDAEAVVIGARGRATQRLTYRQLDARVNRVAHLLVDRGIGPGAHVGLDLRNGLAYLEAMLALHQLRATPVNVNHRYVADELRYLFVDADLAAVLVEPDLADLVRSVAVEVDGLDHVLAVDAAYEEAVAAADPTRVDVGPRSGDDLYLLYTGGTTGMPKGVMWRHEDVYFACLGGRGTPSQGIEPLRRPRDIVERVRRGGPIMRRLPLCPLMHGGASWVALQSLLSGGTVVIATDRHFDAPEALDLLSAERVELVMLIGDATARPIADALAAVGADGRRAVEGWDLSSLAVIASGGAILSPAVKAQLQSLLPTTKVVDTFGASETGGQGRLAAPSGGGPPRLVTDADTAVLDEDGRPLAAGSARIGRLARRGHIPFGYFKDPVKTAATFPVIDGVRWSVPGDLARVEADGAITLLGRGSMSINTGGEKVFPEEVEGVLKAHPRVFDAMVVGVADDRFGQRVAAVVSLRAGDGEPDGSSPSAITDAELDAHARAHLSGYKVPRTWVRVDRCRRLPTGKPDYSWAAEVARAADAHPARAAADPASGAAHPGRGGDR